MTDKSIDLENILPNISSSCGGDYFALDIGGSLVKLVYQVNKMKRVIDVREPSSTQHKGRNDGDLFEYYEKEVISPKLCFIKFELFYLNKCLDFIRQQLLDPAKNNSIGTKYVSVTGGGAHVYRQLIEQKLPGFSVIKEDEMECLMDGCIFLLLNIPDEVFYFKKDDPVAFNFSVSCIVDTYPFLLVNIGSGVSILKVDSDNNHERVGGTSLGGGTFWGIGSLLYPELTFDELLEEAIGGDHRNVDMLIKDIYGRNSGCFDLDDDVIASSFGKHSACDTSEDHRSDALKALLLALSNNIGHIAFLLAKKHNISRILFGGYFIRGHPITMHTLSYAIRFWSHESMTAYFLRHEGYLGAIGAFIKGINKAGRLLLQSKEYHLSKTWSEVGTPMELSESRYPRHRCTCLSKNDASYGRGASGATSPDHSFQITELEHLPVALIPFPLLKEAGIYNPDTWDLTQDSEALSYWLTNVRRSAAEHQRLAFNSQKETSDSAKERSETFLIRYLSFLSESENDPSSHGILTVRRLLDAQESILQQCGFLDSYASQKMEENSRALNLLVERWEYLCALNEADRCVELVRGILAGNMFDSDSESIVEVPESTRPSLTFEIALDRLQTRPWSMDGDVDDWLERCLQSPKLVPFYRHALIFCDNSGCDIILGVLPFALNLLRSGTSRVTLIANSGPALNDVTHHELQILLRRASKVLPESSGLREYLLKQQLSIYENGHASACLDLRCVPRGLADICRDADLIVIEGVERAVLTNLRARFVCDSLKIAVVKNEWLAERLGGRPSNEMNSSGDTDPSALESLCSRVYHIGA